jgi:uncharacterized membrane protein YbhN (UPF0104 family)
MRLWGAPYIYGVILFATSLMLPLLAAPLGGAVIRVLQHLPGHDLGERARQALQVLVHLLSPKGSLVLMLMTLFGILLWVISIKVIATGFGLRVPLLHLAVVATLVELVRLIPITIQGIGLREVTFAYLLSFFGYTPEQCYAVGAISYIALSVALILCGPLGQAIASSGRPK